MLFRYRARNYPDQLSNAEQIRWKSFCRARLTGTEASDRQARMQKGLAELPQDGILLDLQKYFSDLSN
jgi:exodeoxyribonuclease-1